MPNTVPAAATGLPNEPQEAEPKEPRSYISREDFDEALCEWLAAKAAVLALPDHSNAETDEAAFARERAAERALAVTPAPHMCTINAKWQLLDQLMASEQEAGQDTWSPAIVVAASLRSDVLRLFNHGGARA